MQCTQVRTYRAPCRGFVPFHDWQWQWVSRVRARFHPARSTFGRQQSVSLASIRNYGLRALSAVSGPAHLVWFPIFNVRVLTDYLRRWRLGRKRHPYLRIPHPRM